MKFRKISFYQYRCFMEGELSFTSSKDFDKNINLILAPNGTGKTELLFGFWWALYGEDFDFTSLQNKEDTPYALNSEMYRRLQNDEPDSSDYCEVNLEFEHEGKTFILTRKEVYKKTPKRDTLSRTMYVQFSEVNNYGTTSLPITDKDQVERRLERIIPKKTLHGIIFDGERMQKISSANEKAIEGIEGFISDITSRDLIIMAIEELNSVKRRYNKNIRGFAKDKDKYLYDLQGNINDLGEKLEKEKAELLSLNEEQAKADKRINNISDELLLYERTKKIEQNYNAKKQEQKHYEDQYDAKFDELNAELNNFGPLLMTKIMFEKVEEITSTVNIPEGLNVEAVSSILHSNHCICGNELDHKMIETLKALQNKLPPDNVNSVIHEIIRQKNNTKELTTQRLESLWDEMTEFETKKNELKEEVKGLATQLSDAGIDGEKLQQERTKLLNESSDRKARITFLETSIKNNAKELEKLENDRKKFDNKYNEVRNTQSKINFINKSLDALNQIQENYNQLALDKINKNIKQAYKELSEDSEYGRDVYITQYTKQKYKIITYYSQAVEEYLSSTVNWNELETSYGIEGELTDETKREIAILENSVANSTGQSKAVTISFIKAILDYSMTKKDNKEEFEIQKNYPVVIDAPFGDLSGENLTRPASNLHSFSEQVILMLSPDSYESVRTQLENNVGLVHKIEKTKGKNNSKIAQEKSEVSI